MSADRDLLTWLEEPPGPPPVIVDTRLQVLPFDKLRWDDFERLCLRLARLDHEAEYARPYGTPGQRQHGIDLFARRADGTGYTAYQCKKVDQFAPSDITQAVDRFLQGEWAERSDRFTLCTSHSLASTSLADRFRAEHERLARRGVTLIQWDADELSTLLKDHPELVDDFFGPQAVIAFCGPQAAAGLHQRRNRRVRAGEPAGRLLAEVAVYLRALIDWLNTDPWPQDQRFKQQVLIPAAIERKLQVAVSGLGGTQTIGADELAQHCNRLVILGGPGAGKTWLAKRIARRCAETALKSLNEGAALDEVELPLYTTCSRLFAAAGDIRSAAVSGALDHELGDLGGSQLNAAVGRFFTERNAPTTLIIDSLDEAQGPAERLRQASGLPWRVILTSRPSSWNHQLIIDDNDEAQRIGTILPLRYPEDVKLFIRSWFAARPKWGDHLVSQIAQHPALRQAATVPLILAFFCIIGGSQPLPEFRHDLYPKVIRRVLTGRWRSDWDGQPDVDACLGMLRCWAWSGATSHPVSGIGNWADDVPTGPARIDEAENIAVAHIAPPAGSPDIDTGKTNRRFIHRSIREHLVAEHVAGLPRADAAEILLPHLWFDPDWEYAAPAAIAMHPERDQLLLDLIRRAARSAQLPDDLSIIDTELEFAGLLARIAAESRAEEWPPAVAATIDSARIDIARSRSPRDLIPAAHWNVSNDDIRAALLRKLDGTTDRGMARELVDGLIQLDPSGQGQVRAALLRKLDGTTDSGMARELADGLIQLDPSGQGQVRAALLRKLSVATHNVTARELADGLIHLNPSEQDQDQARAALLSHLATVRDCSRARALVNMLLRLDPSDRDKERARTLLLRRLDAGTDNWQVRELADGLIQLNPTHQDQATTRAALLHHLAAPDLLEFGTGSETIPELVNRLIKLDPSDRDKERARTLLLQRIADATASSRVRDLADGLIQLNPSHEDRTRIRTALLHHLGGSPDYGEATRELVDRLIQLSISGQDHAWTRTALLRKLDTVTDPVAACGMVDGLIQLGPSDQDRTRIRTALLRKLHAATDSWGICHLVDGLIHLDPSDRAEARAALLRGLDAAIDDWTARGVVDRLIHLSTSGQDHAWTRTALLGKLDAATDSTARELVSGVLKLNPSDQDLARTRTALLRKLYVANSYRAARGVVDGLIQLDLSNQDRTYIKAVMLRDLDPNPTYSDAASELVHKLIKLDPSERDRAEACAVLLRGLDAATDSEAYPRNFEGLIRLDPSDQVKARIQNFVRGLIRLDPSDQVKARIRTVLVHHLAHATDSTTVGVMRSSLIQLGVTLSDLNNWRAWARPPTAELLAAARRNSQLGDWVEALPSLPKP